jgi:tetratricopeptide (TPR) repeat protein
LLVLFCLTGCSSVIVPPVPPGQQAAIDLGNNNYQAAVEHYTAAIGLDPTDSSLYYGRGLAYLLLNRYSDALPDLTKAVKLRPTDWNALYNRALCYQNLHKYKLALADFTQAIKLRPNDPAAFIARSEVYRLAKSPKSALADADKAIALDPKSADGYAQRGYALQDMKQYARAIDALTKSVRLNPKQSAPFAQRAWCYSILGKDELTIRDCTLAIANGDNDAWTYDMRGVSYANLKKYREASEEYRAALNIDPNHDGARMHLALLPKKYRTPAIVATPASQAAVVSNSAIGDKWGLVIGIGKFADSTIGDLRYCRKDAKDFYKFLVNNAGFQPDHVRLILDKSATERRIKSEFNKFLAHVTRPEDLVVIYITSHGSPSSSDVRGDNYIICHDTALDDLFATSLEMQTLMRMIKERITSRRIVLVLDCCFSGNTTSGTRAIGRGGNMDAQFIAQGTGQMVICSSSSNQTSLESSRYQNGVFTRRLIEGLSQNAGLITVPRAFAYTKAAVVNEVREDYGLSQIPVMHSKWSGNDLIFAVPPGNRRPLPQSVRDNLQPDDSGQ